MSNDKPQSPPRHWHGPVGNRYEHHNVWVVGGPPSSYMASRPSTSTTDAFATSERRSSSASDTSANAGERSPPPSVGERRRSSAHGPSSLFESLTSQKRNTNDGSLAARRQSWSEQSQPGGFFSKWWSGYTGGNK
ncbi:hypothetical protein ASPVEDRAFT_133959 [Aspergillus versicolor CBS 583.65]|uniref:Uncharacterized protein n=1 Tax=Aspergillus versicolor CBS 583.65 TaxID=1036611 RepID=A0A1L9PQ17_ASPVE|nr:uncharacterized protein ASPVEDRAFT_133959 [Aspergillus versicolor CBS 583.65]OJJ03628.1 hypothetical protein ASPVEDRAFT_133959 [Aspergillus versicolor CBS 583.65]